MNIFYQLGTRSMIFLTNWAPIPPIILNWAILLSNNIPKLFLNLTPTYQQFQAYLLGEGSNWEFMNMLGTQLVESTS
jgi:hypothetical protein